MLILDEPETADIGSDRRTPNGVMNRLCSMPVTSGKDQLPIRTGFRLELFERGNQWDMIFGGMFEPGNVQKEWEFQRVRTHGFTAILRRAGIKPLVIQPVVNDCDMLPPT